MNGHRQASHASFADVAVSIASCIVQPSGAATEAAAAWSYVVEIRNTGAVTRDFWLRATTFRGDLSRHVIKARHAHRIDRLPPGCARDIVVELDDPADFRQTSLDEVQVIDEQNAVVSRYSPGWDMWRARPGPGAAGPRR